MNIINYGCKILFTYDENSFELFKTILSHFKDNSQFEENSKFLYQLLQYDIDNNEIPIKILFEGIQFNYIKESNIIGISTFIYIYNFKNV